jgi:ATP-dependent RNA helicase DeaD
MPASDGSTPPATDLVDLPLPPALLEAVLDLGWVRATPIQAATIPALLAGRDVLGVAQTGTGKTAAFGLPLVAAVDATPRVQGLVIVPTRELALQVADAVTAFARGSGVRVATLYGGSPFLPQRRAIADGAQVVVGTPGRLLDHLSRGSLDLTDLRMLVLDEADEMLRMGFAEDVETLAAAAPARRVTALFSATMPPAIARVAATHLRDPLRVEVARPASTVATVRQTYAVVPARHKIGALARVLATTGADATIVFTRTRSAADEVGTALVGRGVPAATISGDVAQKDRERIVERLRDGSLDVLVATDVAARGLDVERIGLVVNFDVPTEPDAYVHRIGRTGRAGRSGESLTFVTPNEQHRLRAIERATRHRLEEVTVPTPADVSAHRVGQLLEQVPARVAAGRLDAYRDAVRAAVADGTDPVDLAAALAALAVGDLRGIEPDEVLAPTPIQEATGAVSENGRVSFTSEERARTAARRPVNGTRYRVAVGHTHGTRPEAIVGAITGEGGLRGADLGRIDIFATFSLVEITAELTPEQYRRIGAAKVGGRPLRIAVDRGPRGRSAARTTAHAGTHHGEAGPGHGPGGQPAARGARRR